MHHVTADSSESAKFYVANQHRSLAHPATAAAQLSWGSWKQGVLMAGSPGGGFNGISWSFIPHRHGVA